MILPDVNVLIYAHREDAVDHERYRRWLEETILSGQPYGLSDHVLSGFLRRHSPADFQPAQPAPGRARFCTAGSRAGQPPGHRARSPALANLL